LRKEEHSKGEDGDKHSLTVAQSNTQQQQDEIDVLDEIAAEVESEKNAKAQQQQQHQRDEIAADLNRLQHMKREMNLQRIPALTSRLAELERLRVQHVNSGMLPSSALTQEIEAINNALANVVPMVLTSRLAELERLRVQHVNSGMLPPSALNQEIESIRMKLYVKGAEQSQSVLGTPHTRQILPQIPSQQSIVVPPQQLSGPFVGSTSLSNHIANHRELSHTFNNINSSNLLGNLSATRGLTNSNNTNLSELTNDKSITARLLENQRKQIALLSAMEKDKTNNALSKVNTDINVYKSLLIDSNERKKLALRDSLESTSVLDRRNYATPASSAIALDNGWRKRAILEILEYENAKKSTTSAQQTTQPNPPPTASLSNPKQATTMDSLKQQQVQQQSIQEKSKSNENTTVQRKLTIEEQKERNNQIALQLQEQLASGALPIATPVTETSSPPPATTPIRHRLLPGQVIPHRSTSNDSSQSPKVKINRIESSSQASMHTQQQLAPNTILGQGIPTLQTLHQQRMQLGYNQWQKQQINAPNTSLKDCCRHNLNPATIPRDPLELDDDWENTSLLEKEIAWLLEESEVFLPPDSNRSQGWMPVLLKFAWAHGSLELRESLAEKFPSPVTTLIKKLSGIIRTEETDAGFICVSTLLTDPSVEKVTALRKEAHQAMLFGFRRSDSIEAELKAIQRSKWSVAVEEVGDQHTDIPRQIIGRPRHIRKKRSVHDKLLETALGQDTIAQPWEKKEKKKKRRRGEKQQRSEIDVDVLANQKPTELTPLEDEIAWLVEESLILLPKDMLDNETNAVKPTPSTISAGLVTKSAEINWDFVSDNASEQLTKELERIGGIKKCRGRPLQRIIRYHQKDVRVAFSNRRDDIASLLLLRGYRRKETKETVPSHELLMQTGLQKIWAVRLMRRRQNEKANDVSVSAKDLDAACRIKQKSPKKPRSPKKPKYAPTQVGTSLTLTAEEEEIAWLREEFEHEHGMKYYDWDYIEDNCSVPLLLALGVRECAPSSFLSKESQSRLKKMVRVDIPSVKEAFEQKRIDVRHAITKGGFRRDRSEHLPTIPIVPKEVSTPIVRKNGTSVLDVDYSYTQNETICVKKSQDKAAFNWNRLLSLQDITGREGDSIVPFSLFRNCLNHFKQVKEDFATLPQLYDNLIKVVEHFINTNGDEIEFICHIMTILDEYPELILGLNKVLPDDYKIDISDLQSLDVNVINRDPKEGKEEEKKTEVKRRKTFDESKVETAPLHDHNKNDERESDMKEEEAKEGVKELTGTRSHPLKSSSDSDEVEIVDEKDDEFQILSSEESKDDYNSD